MTLVVGLGNPGSEYRNSRHNLGWQVLDEVARRHRLKFTRGRAQALVAGWGSTLLAMPQTYMNLSGSSVQGLRDLHRLPVDRIWVIHDDLDTPLGELRLRKGGGAGGHNGVASVIAGLGSSDFPRFRLGLGRPVGGDGQADFVLTAPGAQERPLLQAAVRRCAEALEVALVDGFDAAMNRFNGRGAPA
ncbi:MAG: aminoacyl-tRNA hydrolase [Candidatus Dormibacteria bacterium]